MKKHHLLNCAAFSALSLALVATPAMAQVDEIIVTATKRAESAQDIPVAVTALGENTLEELDVDIFTDYLLQLPGVNASSTGPGQGTVYIRGIASTPALLTVSGAAGLAPNVAMYLDEQPTTQVGRNLDVYAADLERVEVLPGPQGTLFGASSQAGTIRLITNKPKLGVEEAKLNFGTSFTEGGDASFNAEAIYNLPITDNFAMRALVYVDHQGGYIDNVAGTISARDSGRFRSAGTVRPNGTVINTTDDGFQSDSAVPGISYDGINFVEANNDAFVEDNFNDARYTGYRVSGLWDVTENTTLSMTHSGQTIDSEGVFFADPELDSDLTSIQRYTDDTSEDRFSNTSWTVESRLGMLDMVYTGAFLEREVDQTTGYTDYLYVAQYLPYYICDGSVSYPGDALNPTGTCNTPATFVDSETDVETVTHELRFTTPSENRLRATFGAFMSDQELLERNDFTYPGSADAIAFDGVSTGFGPNNPLPGSTVSDPSARLSPVIFFNDLKRTDEQIGLFGEASYELIEDTLTASLGARYHDVRVDIVGSANSSFFNFCGSETNCDADAFGANLDFIFDGNNVNERDGSLYPSVIPDKAVAEGYVFKGNLSWTPDADKLFYITYSEGFRPGLPNRPAFSGGGAVPAIVDTDELTNYEAGWKLRLLDNTLQFNGSVFFVEIQDLQTTIFDPNVTNLFFSDNAADAEVTGLEADFIWAPSTIEGLTVNGAVSLLNAEVTELVGASVAIAGPGSDLSYAPAFQGNVRARYEWPLDNGNDMYVQGQISHSGSSFSDIVLINRAEQDAYTLLNSAIGYRTDGWGAEFFVSNLTDERAQINNNLNYDRERIAINRPRTYGVRFNIDFGQ